MEILLPCSSFILNNSRVFCANDEFQKKVEKEERKKKDQETKEMVQKFYKLYKIGGEEFCKRYQNFSKQSLLKAAKKKKKKEKKIILR